MAQALGIIDIIWRGQKLAVKAGAKFQNGGIQQKEIIVGGQVDYMREMVAGKTTAAKSFRRGDSLAAIYAPGEGELQVLCDTGQSYVGQAFLSNRPALTGDSGTLDLEWTHGEFEEQVA